MELALQNHIEDIRSYINKIYQDINVNARKDFAEKMAEQPKVRFSPEWESALLLGDETVQGFAKEALNESIQNLIIGITDEAGMNYHDFTIANFEGEYISESTGVQVQIFLAEEEGTDFDVVSEIHNPYDYLNLYAIIWDIMEWTDKLIARLRS